METNTEVQADMLHNNSDQFLRSSSAGRLVDNTVTSTSLSQVGMYLLSRFFVWLTLDNAVLCLKLLCVACAGEFSVWCLGNNHNLQGLARLLSI